MSPQRRKDAKNIGMYVIVPRNEHFFSHKSGSIVCKPLRLCVAAVYELFRLENLSNIILDYFQLQLSASIPCRFRMSNHAVLCVNHDCRLTELT